MNKKIKVLILILIIFVFILLLRSTYSKYISVGTAEVNKDIGQWIIKINSVDVTEVDDDGNPIVQEFDIDTFEWSEDTHTVAEKMAPGRKGSFELVIDPTDTDVAFDYEITINKPEIILGDPTVTDVTSDDIVMKISDVEIDTGKTIDFSYDDNTSESTITRFKPLSEIQSADDTTRLDTLNIEFEWENDENNNERDSNIAKTYNNEVLFHVIVKALQHTD